METIVIKITKLTELEGKPNSRSIPEGYEDFQSFKTYVQIAKSWIQV